jgi:hypothetical protein
MACLVRFFMVLGLVLVPPYVGADETNIKPTGPNILGQKVQVTLEIRGNLSADFDGESATTIPLEVDGQFDYRERQLRSQKSTRHIRDYETAKAQIDYGSGQQKSSLSRGNTWIIADRRQDPDQGKRVRFLTSTSGLKQSELDLLSIPANSLVWDTMLAHDGAAVGQKWSPPSDALADVLVIDKVQENDVQIEVTQIQRGVAQIRVTGTAKGLIDDAETEIGVEGMAEFDLTAGFTRQLTLTLRENRTICESAPGYDAVIRLEMRVQRPSDDVFPQSEIETEKLNERQWTDALVLENVAKTYRLRYDRRWRLISNDEANAILRYVDNNILLGQCSIQTLNSLPSPSAYSLEEFRKDVAKSTANKGEIVDDEQFATDRGLQVFQIDVRGKAEDVDLTWRYYHAADEDGNRVSFVVTFDTEVATRFDGLDRRLLDSIQFLKRAAASEQAEKPTTTVK